MIQAPGLVRKGEIKIDLMKCQIIETTCWTEKEYEEDNSLEFREEFSIYLEGKARGLRQMQRKKGKK